MGTTYAEAQLFQEAINMHWGSLYPNPYWQGSDIALGTPGMVPGIPKSGHSCTLIQITPSILMCRSQKVGNMCNGIQTSDMYAPRV